MNEDLITVIVPVYNVERYLQRCVNSILEQTYKNLEIILVDDGSTDNSPTICDEYSQNHTNIKVIHKKNAGLGYARNSGLEMTNGKYVVFVDSDDYIENKMIENLYTAMINNNADTCIGGFKRVFNDQTVIHKNKYAGNKYHNDDIMSFVLPRMLGKLPNGTDYIEMSVWKVLFSMDIINAYTLRFPSERELISEDIVFDLSYYIHSDAVCMCDDVGYCYCDNEGTLTTKYRPERFELQKKLYLYIQDKTNEIGIEDISKIRRMTTYISNTRYCIKLEAKNSKNNGKKRAINNITKICNDELTIGIFKDFPHSTVPIKSRIINILIKNRKYRTLYHVMSLREYLKI